MNPMNHRHRMRRRELLAGSAMFDDLFPSFAVRPMWRSAESSTPDMPVDVTEDDKAYTVKAELPGVEKKDIEVTVEGSQLSIGAEVKRETRSDADQDIVVERVYGRVYRSFTLPTEVDGDAVQAQYNNGVLSLTLPKRTSGDARKITVR